MFNTIDDVYCKNADSDTGEIERNIVRDILIER